MRAGFRNPKPREARAERRLRFAGRGLGPAGAGGRIRTCVAVRRRFYRPLDLTTLPPLRGAAVASAVHPRTAAARWSPRGDSNPLTYRLQIGCAAIAPLGLDGKPTLTRVHRLPAQPKDDRPSVYESPSKRVNATREGSAEERPSLRQHFGDHRPGSPASESCVSRSPVQAPDLVGQHHSSDRAIGWQFDLERVASDPGCDGTQQCDAGTLVVDTRTHHEGGPSACLFVPRLRRELQPDEITALGQVWLVYHTSSPCGSPQSTSGWAFAGVMPATSSARS